MSAEEIRTPIVCEMRDCIHFSVDHERVFCTHPEKKAHLNVNPCPLYRLDWQRTQREGRDLGPRS